MKIDILLRKLPRERTGLAESITPSHILLSLTQLGRKIFPKKIEENFIRITQEASDWVNHWADKLYVRRRRIRKLSEVDLDPYPRLSSPGSFAGSYTGGFRLLSEWDRVDLLTTHSCVDVIEY